MPNQNDSKKIALVTGATDGVGKATAIGLAKRGYTLVVHGRSEEKAETLRREIAAESADAEIHIMLADFSRLSEVRRLADEFGQKFGRLDVLINNAAAMFSGRNVTADGFEATFAINVLAPFLLTDALLDKLKAAPHARIVNVSSVGYKSAKPDLDDLQSSKQYNMQRVYFNSKLYILYISLELARRLQPFGITVNAVHPGGVRTQLARDFRGPMKWLFAAMMPLFFISPEEGAEPSIRAASAAELEGVTGKYFTRKGEEALLPIANDRPSADRIWAVCEQLTQPWRKT